TLGKIEKLAQQAPRALRNQNLSSRRTGLQPRSKVWGLAGHRALLGRPGAGQVADYDQPSRNPDPCRKALAMLGRNIPNRAGAHRAFSIVLVRLGVAEIYEDPIAHVLRYEPAEALHGFGDALLVDRNDLAQVFRVHAGRQRR